MRMSKGNIHMRYNRNIQGNHRGAMGAPGGDITGEATPYGSSAEVELLGVQNNTCKASGSVTGRVDPVTF